VGGTTTGGVTTVDDAPPGWVSLRIRHVSTLIPTLVAVTAGLSSAFRNVVNLVISTD
jgi:hypothetical protein